MGTADKQGKKKTKRARLGRGLSSLVDPAPIKVDSPAFADANQNHNRQSNTQDIQTPALDDHQRVHEINVVDIHPNPHQPRRTFDDEALQTLADSIAQHGLMQPIVVRRKKGSDEYELIAGERRWRATRRAGLESIRAIVDDATDQRSAELALIENMQRSDLNPIERAGGLRTLIDQFGLTQQLLADRIGISRSALANSLRLLDLGEEVQAMIASSELSVGHAKVLLSVQDQSQRLSLAQEAVRNQWTVRVLEQQCGKPPTFSSGRKPEKLESNQEPTRLDSVLRDMERRLSEYFGTRVTLNTNSGGTKGRVQIEFYDLDQFDGLLTKMGIQGTSE
jgi:ParB family chromosome partitioning protein